MITCPQIKNGKMLGKIETLTIIAQFDEEATLINADGVGWTNNADGSVIGGNGLIIYSKSANPTEVKNMLDSSIAGNWPRWQNGVPNACAFFKTPRKGILTSYLTTQWCDDNSTGRICNHWKITGYETEADMLALANGVVLDDNTWASASKGASKTIQLGNNKPFQYYTIQMVSNFAGGSYCSMGTTKLYMRLPNQHEVQVKRFKLFGKRR